MGNEIYVDYTEAGRKHVGSIGKAGWREMRKILPLMLDFINEEMRSERPIHLGDGPVLVWDGDPLRPIAIGLRGDPASQTPFTLEQLLDDKSDVFDEIYFRNPDEVIRLFAWAKYISSYHGAFDLYVPVIEGLKARMHDVEQYASANISR